MKNDYDIRPLAAAVILQAVHDARQGKDEARKWLLGDGELWLYVCGVSYDPQQIEKRIKRKAKPRGSTRLGNPIKNKRALARIA